METVSVLITTFIGFLIYFIYKKLRSPYVTIKSWGVRSLPCYPIIGNFAWNLGPWDINLHQRYKHERVIGVQSFRTPFMFVMDREMVKRILVKDFHAFRDRMLLAISPAPLNKTVFSLSNEHWKHVRGLVSPTLTSGKLKAMSGLLDQAVQNAVDYLEERADSRQPIEAKQFFTRFTIDAVASTLFGLDMDSHRNQDHPFVHHALNSLNVTVTNPWLILPLLIPELMHIFTKFGSFLIRTGALSYYQRIIEQILEDRRENPEQVRHDFMNTIASSEISDSECDKVSIHALGHVSRWSEKGLTRDEILSQGVAFMAAGFETTATTLHMLAYCLATHPDIQEKVRAEINDVIGDKEVEYDDLTKFPYLDMCVQETLRVYPPANRLERRCNQTVDLDGIIVPEGTLILIPIYALGMDPEYFPDPHIFNPERFSPENKPAIHQYTYLPFGTGPRNCPGMRLAWQEMRLLMVKLVQKFRIEPSSETKMPDELDFEYTGFLRVNSPVRLNMVPL